jgi:hypothetical protein
MGLDRTQIYNVHDLLNLNEQHTMHKDRHQDFTQTILKHPRHEQLLQAKYKPYVDNNHILHNIHADLNVLINEMMFETKHKFVSTSPSLQDPTTFTWDDVTQEILDEHPDLIEIYEDALALNHAIQTLFARHDRHATRAMNMLTKTT